MNNFAIGERVQLTDSKSRKFTIILTEGGQFHTHKGAINHDDIIGKEEGILVYSSNANAYLVLRPLLVDFMMSMPRGATIIYPKDSAQIILEGDIHPGMHVLEAGAGSGALTCNLLRTLAGQGKLTSLEIRSDHAEVAKKNVEVFFGKTPENWDLILDDICDENLINNHGFNPQTYDRIVLDMLHTDKAISNVHKLLKPGGVLTCYIASVTQLSKTVELLRLKGWTEPRVWESLVRGWHVVGLAVRPDHRMQAHTAFLLTTRKLPEDIKPPEKQLHSSKKFRMNQMSSQSESANIPFEHILE